MLPGFIGMVFKGGTQSNEYSSDTVASLPREVRDQLARVFNAAWDAQTRVVIGPKFSKAASQSAIAQNYLFGIQALVAEGQLDSNSAFIQAARTLFSAQLESGDQMFLNSSNLAFTKQAKPGMETTIANAIETVLAQ